MSLSIAVAAAYLGIAFAYLYLLLFGGSHEDLATWLTAEPLFHWTKWVSSSILGVAMIGWLPIFADWIGVRRYPLYRWVYHLFVIATAVGLVRSFQQLGIIPFLLSEIAGEGDAYRQALSGSYALIDLDPLALLRFGIDAAWYALTGLVVLRGSLLSRGFAYGAATIAVLQVIRLVGLHGIHSALVVNLSGGAVFGVKVIWFSAMAVAHARSQASSEQNARA